uniref:Palmitoyltransferase n=1 Tax=Blastobotrys adeninivorans TaxID=409370 RepID=A0A060T1V5_BLAAD
MILFQLERLCCALASWFPRVGVNLLTTWGIYTHIFKLCIPKFQGLVRVVFILSGLAFYVLATIAYARTVNTGPGSPLQLKGFSVRPEDIDLERAAPPPEVMNNVTAKDNGEMRFCSKCSCWKPDRTHHCSTCKRCVLRMDHHCPWFAVCIGFRNHKFFVQFLVYVSLLCMVAFASSLTVVIKFFQDGEEKRAYLSMSWIALLLTSGVMGLAVTLFAGYSVYLVVTNQTTLEALEAVRYRSQIPASEYRSQYAPDSRSIGNLFDIGISRNWREIMGYRVYEWFLPIHPRGMGNGTSFPINEQMWQSIHEYSEREAQYLYQQRQRMAHQVRQDWGKDDEDYVDYSNADTVESIPLRQHIA